MNKNLFVLVAACFFYGSSSCQTALKVKISIISTMMADFRGVGEWGFSALVEVDSTKILFDTGGRDGIVRDNASELGIDLSGIRQLVLSHNHIDHTGGLVSLRDKFSAADGLSVTYIGKDFFLREAVPVGMHKATDSLAYAKSGGRFMVVDGFTEISPSIYLTGPVPRKYPEKNYPKGKTLHTNAGTVEDNVPEDITMVIKTTKGLIMLSGCGHAGIVNTMEYVQQKFPGEKIVAAVGGFHLLDTEDEKLAWTAAKIKEAGVQYLIGAHCTGVNAVYKLRETTGLSKNQCVVGTVGSSFSLDKGIALGWMR